MAYVHCHECNWQQDDFWSWGGYNPLRFFLTTDLPWLAKPRFVGTDPHFLKPGRIASLFTRMREVPWVDRGNVAQVEPDGTPCAGKIVKEYSQHSWFMLGWSATHLIRRLFTQRWWTYKGWREDVKKGIGGCPKCGKSLCID